MSAVDAISSIVTAAGMVSPLGRDYVMSCASERAGIRRTTELDVDVYDEETGELVPVVGNAIHGFTDGFIGPARIVRLASAALRDLLSRAQLEERAWARTGLFITLPGGYYHLSDLRRSLEAAEQPSDMEDRLRQEQESYQARLREALTLRLPDIVGLSVPPQPIRLYFNDQAGIVEAIQEAQELLSRRQCDRCIIGGVDSLVDDGVVRILDRLELLKTPLRTSGIIPGEAAAFFMLERSDAARNRNGSSLASIRAPVHRRDSMDRFAGARPEGGALSEAVAATSKSLMDTATFKGRLMSPLTGDVWKAQEWGHALIAMPEHIRAAVEWAPAEGFGDVGAAAGAAAVCLSISAFQRGYADGDAVMVCLSSDNGGKGAFIVTK